MAHVELTAEELSALKEILTSCLSDLRMEIAGTDSREWRTSMKQREVLINGLIARLAAIREVS
jgi:hypothetical protein